jgi:LytS/YehU family sensor histidine kinase
LYENASAQVSLQKELSLLQEYIDLEKLTNEREIEMHTAIEAAPNHQTIAPFIILPLVENAFKQVSVFLLNKAEVHVNIQLQQDVLHIY